MFTLIISIVHCGKLTSKAEFVYMYINSYGGTTTLHQRYYLSLQILIPSFNFCAQSGKQFHILSFKPSRLPGALCPPAHEPLPARKWSSLEWQNYLVCSSGDRGRYSNKIISLCQSGRWAGPPHAAAGVSGLLTPAMYEAIPGYKAWQMASVMLPC